MLDRPTEITINATAFKARCLDLMDQLASHRLTQVTITKRGKPVSVMRAPGPPEAKPSIIGSQPKRRLSADELIELDISTTGLMADDYEDHRAAKLEARLLRAS